jgi:hypothetical protein
MIFVVVVVDVYLCVWFCTCGTTEIGCLAVLFVWNFASVMMLRVDTVS